LGALGRTLKDAVRNLAYSTSVEHLRKRGVKSVNVVGLDRMVSLVERAVHVSLRNKLRGLEREQIADATKAEFVRLMKSKEALEKSRDEALEQKRRAEEAVDELRRAIKQQKQALSERMAEAEVDAEVRYAGEDAEIRRGVDELFNELTRGEHLDLVLMHDKVLELVMSRVGEGRKEVLQAREAARDREVELMERRITKLTRSLEVTEARLAEVARTGVTEGISSIYRQVQGLNPQDAQFDKKRELMKAIFDANLALQTAMAE
jgi:hypothetical protein